MSGSLGWDALLWPVIGWLAWPLVEYGVHGVLAHRHRKWVGPFHWGHHKNPRAVFTSPYAWVPGALLFFALSAALLGVPRASLFVGGLLAGFVHYEHVHWRIHYREPRNERERLLRAHHLAHHFRDPNHYHGVTTRLWDRVFGTLPSHWRDDYSRVAQRPALRGDAGLREIYGPAGLRHTWQSLRASLGRRGA